MLSISARSLLVLALSLMTPASLASVSGNVDTVDVTIIKVIDKNGYVDTDNNGYRSKGDVLTFRIDIVGDARNEVLIGTAGAEELASGTYYITDSWDMDCMQYQPDSTTLWKYPYSAVGPTKVPLTDGENEPFPLHPANLGYYPQANLNTDWKLLQIDFTFTITCDCVQVTNTATITEKVTGESESGTLAVGVPYNTETQSMCAPVPVVPCKEEDYQFEEKNKLAGCDICSLSGAEVEALELLIKETFNDFFFACCDKAGRSLRRVSIDTTICEQRLRRRLSESAYAQYGGCNGDPTCGGQSSIDFGYRRRKLADAFVEDIVMGSHYFGGSARHHRQLATDTCSCAEGSTGLVFNPAIGAYQSAGNCAPTETQLAELINKGIEAATNGKCTQVDPDFEQIERIVTKKSGASGDPHFRTWSGERYDFHGVCDLVLLSNPGFGNGKSLDVHVRTTRTRMWSYISSAAIRIGRDILEVTGGHSGFNLWINREKQEDFDNENSEDEYKVLSTKLSGEYTILAKKRNDRSSEYVVELGSGGERIVLSTWNSYVRVDFIGATLKSFGDSVGLMGRYEDGSRMARDNLTVMEDMNEFGQEWQVQSAEPKLFHDIAKGHPQYPSRCEIPSSAELRRRLSDSTIGLEDAQVACARVGDDEERELCVFDVMATNDKGVAGAY